MQCEAPSWNNGVFCQCSFRVIIIEHAIELVCLSKLRRDFRGDEGKVEEEEEEEEHEEEG